MKLSCTSTSTNTHYSSHEFYQTWIPHISRIHQFPNTCSRIHQFYQTCISVPKHMINLVCPERFLKLFSLLFFIISKSQTKWYQESNSRANLQWSLCTWSKFFTSSCATNHTSSGSPLIPTFISPAYKQPPKKKERCQHTRTQIVSPKSKFKKPISIKEIDKKKLYPAQNCAKIRIE